MSGGRRCWGTSEVRRGELGALQPRYPGHLLRSRSWVCSRREAGAGPEPCGTDKPSTRPRSLPRDARYRFPPLFYHACLRPQNEPCLCCLFSFCAGFATSEKAQTKGE